MTIIHEHHGAGPMHLDSNPLFRKAITPWYDSNLACFIQMLFMVLVALFGWAGMKVAFTYPQYRPYAWVPAALLIFSLLVLCTVIFRLIRRYYGLHAIDRGP